MPFEDGGLVRVEQLRRADVPVSRRPLRPLRSFIVHYQGESMTIKTAGDEVRPPLPWAPCDR